MKKTHIILLLLVAAAVCVIVVNFADFSSYETFASAAKEPGKKMYVIGTLDTTHRTQYDPLQDPNHFTFFVKDEAGHTNKVVFNGAKPTDIEKSESIVMMGHMDGNVFRCKSIQMKCPSKYKNDQIAIGGES